MTFRSPLLFARRAAAGALVVAVLALIAACGGPSAPSSMDNAAAPVDAEATNDDATSPAYIGAPETSNGAVLDALADDVDHDAVMARQNARTVLSDLMPVVLREPLDVEYLIGTGVGDPLDPVVATVRDKQPNEPTGRAVSLTASSFADRAFQYHKRWADLWLNELILYDVAGIEADIERITFDDEYLQSQTQRVLDVTADAARRRDRSLLQHVREMGYPSREAYETAMHSETARILIYEHLFWLQFERWQKVELRVIKVKAQGDTLERARGIVARLRDGEIKWATAVRQYAVNQTDYIGWVTEAAPMLGPVREAVFALKKGETSDPVVTEQGVEIYHAVDTRVGKPDVTYADVAEEIRAKVSEQRAPGSLSGDQILRWMDWILSTHDYTIEKYFPRPPGGPPIIGAVTRNARTEDEAVEETRHEISVRDFVAHAYYKNPDWAEIVMSKVLVHEIARREALMEGIALTDRDVQKARDDYVAWLKDSAARSRRTWQQLLNELGFGREEDLLLVLAEQLADQMLLEYLVGLHDVRSERIDLWHIQLPNEEYAKTVREMVVSGEGTLQERFMISARRYSTNADTRSRGGQMAAKGWVVRGTYENAIEDVAFDLPVKTVSQPVRVGDETNGVWHLFVVFEKLPPKTGSFRELRGDVEDLLGIGQVGGGLVGDRIDGVDVLRWLSSIVGTERYEVTVTFLEQWRGQTGTGNGRDEGDGDDGDRDRDDGDNDDGEGPN